MTRFAAIDLARLTPPELIEEIDAEAIFVRKRDALIATAPDLAAALALESDPLTMLLQREAFDEAVLRAHMNDGIRSCMLATATGAALENLAAFLGVSRLVLVAADPGAIPPVAEVLEPDAALRDRIQLAIEAQTTAGTVGSFTFFARSTDPDVKDVAISQPVPGTVRVTVLGRAGDGDPAPATLDAVADALNDEDVRVLCFTVEVVPATIVNFTVEATLTFYDGPDQAVVLQSAEAALESYLEDRRLIGHDVTISGLHAALHQPGVQNVVLALPAADIEIGDDSAGFCTAITLTNGGIDV